MTAKPSLVIQSVLAGTDVVLAIIGRGWFGVGDDGATRLSDPHDSVRVEIETAFRNRLLIIPVLVNGASIPTMAKLPESLFDLPFLNAAPVSSGQDFHVHMNRLIAATDLSVKQRAAAEEAANQAAAKAEADRLEKAREEADRIAAEDAEADRIKKAKEDADRIAAEKAKADQLKKAKEDVDRIAAEKAEWDRIKTEREDAEADRLRGERRKRLVRMLVAIPTTAVFAGVLVAVLLLNQPDPNPSPAQTNAAGSASPNIQVDTQPPKPPSVNPIIAPDCGPANLH